MTDSTHSPGPAERSRFAPLVRRRWWLVAALVAGVLALGVGLQKAAIPDNSIRVWFLESDPQLANYERFQDTFGNDENILLMVDDPKGVLRRESLETLQTLVERLRSIPGVARVHSIVSSQDAVMHPDGLAFHRPLEAPLPESDAELAALTQGVLESRSFRDRLVSADGRRAMLWIEMAVMGDIDVQRDAIVASVDKTAQEVLGSGPPPMAGIGVIFSGLNVATERDAGVFMGASLLLMFAALWWMFRSLRIVGAALGAVTLGVIGSLGLYGLLGHQLNMVTAMLPSLVIVLGIADAVHFPVGFGEEMRQGPGRDRLSLVVATLRRTFLPCLITTATTVVGFLSLATAPMAVIRDLGIYAGIGLTITFFAAALLMSVAFHGLASSPRVPEHPGLDALVERIQHFLLRRPRWLAVGVVVGLGVSALGASRVVSDTWTLGYLPSDHRVVKDHERITRDWGFYVPLDFTVVPAHGGSASSPEILAGLERFERAALGHPEVRDAFGVHTLYRRMADVFGAQLAEGEPLPAPMVSQLDLVLDSQELEWDRTRPEFTDNFLAPVRNEENSLGRMTLAVDLGSARQIGRLLADLEPLAKDAMRGEATLVPSGYVPLYVQIIDYVTTSQINSFFVAVAVIFGMMWIWLRSLRLALISLLPNLAPILVMFGFMGFAGINLDVATATIGAIVIGVAIDDTVHFLHYWKKYERQGLPFEECLQRSLAVAGRAALIVSLLLIAGYSVLLLASVKTVAYFGLLTVVSGVAAFFCDLAMLPLLLRLWPDRSVSKRLVPTTTA